MNTTTDTVPTTVETIPVFVFRVRQALAVACGGWSQYSPQALACALKGHLRNGLVEYDLRVLADEAIRQERQRWQEHWSAAWGASLRRAMSRK